MDPSVWGERAGTQAVGIYDTNTGFGSFLYTSGTFTPIQIPGVSNLAADAINDYGVIGGTYTSSTGVGLGFMYNGQTFQSIAVPGAVSTNVFGINDLGDIVGDYTDSSGITHGFEGIPEATPPTMPVPESSTLIIACCGTLVGIVIAAKKRSGPADRSESPAGSPQSLTRGGVVVLGKRRDINLQEIP